MGNLRHGHARNGQQSPEYFVWQGMLARCRDPKAKDFKYYGGRGITVCERWRDSFEAFLADMGSRPSSSHRIERENNDVGYEPSNCRWATSRDQARNRSSNRILTFQGRTQCLAAWAAELGVSSAALRSRLAKGHSLETALTMPLQRRGTVLDPALDGRRPGGHHG